MNPGTWQRRALGDICVTTSGGTPSRSRPEFFGGDIPWIKSGDLTDGAVESCSEYITQQGLSHSSAKIFNEGTILLAMYGATVGKLGVLGMRAATNQAVCGITPSDALDRRFLFYFLLSQRPNLIGQSIGGAQPNISQTIIRELMLPIPPLPDQQRIVDLLTRAEGIVRLRREAAAKAAELIPAIFIDMFGDPLTNPKQLSIRKVEDVVAKFEGGKNIQAGDGEASNLRILKVSAVTSGTYVESECKPAPNDYVPPTQHFVRVGDMLFSRANTSELVGATALVEHTNGSTLLPDKLWRFVWKEEVVPSYMWALFQSKAVRQQLSKLASGTSDSMRNISQAKLFELDLPIAKLEDQRRFGELINSARSIQVQQQTALIQAQAAFNALLAQTFAPHGSLGRDEAAR